MASVHVIHHPGGFQGQQAGLLDIHTRVGDDVDIAPQAGQGLAEGSARQGPLTQ
jgi:hypothetical protein